MRTQIAIIGGGISGLTAAFYLHKKGIPFVLLEKEQQSGGALKSEKLDGYSLERGANTVAMNVELQEMIADLGLEAEIEKPFESSHKRYIYRNGSLHALTQSPLSLFKSSLLSRSAKWRLAREAFVSSKSDGTESVAEFFSRRIGREAYEYLVAAGLQGVYAGIAEQMHMKSVMPALVEMEEEKGSLLKGLIARQKEAKKSGAPKRSIFAVKGGMNKLAERIREVCGESIRTSTAVDKLKKTERGYQIEAEGMVFEAEQLIYAAPAHAANMLEEMSPELSRALLRIPYAPMILLHLAYDATALGQAVDGFGFLIPPKENTALLGAIWNSGIFSERSPKEKRLFTLFVGGARQPDLDPQHSRSHIEQAQQEFEKIMKIESPAVFQDLSYWKCAIPQYSMRHPEILAEIRQAQESLPNFHLIGNYIQGVSVGDCVARAKKLVASL